MGNFLGSASVPKLPPEELKAGLLGLDTISLGVGVAGVGGGVEGGGVVEVGGGPGDTEGGGPGDTDGGGTAGMAKVLPEGDFCIDALLRARVGGLDGNAGGVVPGMIDTGILAP